MAYPNKIDTTTDLPIAIDNVTPVSGAIFNKLRSAVIAVQSELGVKPSGTFGTIKARFDYIDFLFTNLNAVSLGKDLGGTTTETLVIGIQGNPVSSATPNLNDALIWNGIAWEPNSIALFPAQSQSEWHIDYINGDDSNTGLDINNKIKTFGELKRRTGPVWTLLPGVVSRVYVYEDVPSTDPAYFNIINLGGRLYVSGVPRVKRTITLSSFRTRVTSTNTPNGATATGVSSWLAARGLDLNDAASGDAGSQGLYRITSAGVNNGAFIWAIKDEGGGTVRLTDGGIPTNNDDLNENFLGIMSGNETLEQLRLPIIENVIFVNSTGNILKSPGQIFGNCTFQFLQFNVPDHSFQFNKLTLIDGPFFGFRECLFTGSILDVVENATFLNCILTPLVMGLTDYAKTYSTQGALLNSLLLPLAHSDFEIGRYNLIQGCSMNPQDGHFHITTHTRGLGIFDSTTTILNFINNSSAFINGPIWGTGNTGYGLIIGGGSKVWHNQEAKTIVATSGDLLIGGRTSLPAYDPATDSWTTPRTINFTNLATSVASGGFGQSISYPALLCGLIANS